MWELDHKGDWQPKKWCFWAAVLEKTLLCPLDSKEIKPTHPKGNQPWAFIGRIDVKAAAPILWPPDEKSKLIGKDSDAGKIESKRRRGRQRMRWLDSITDSVDMNLSKLPEIVEDRGAWHATVYEVTKSWTWLSKWKTTTWRYKLHERLFHSLVSQAVLYSEHLNSCIPSTSDSVGTQ